MEKHINTYQGMNKDAAYDTIASTFYIDALDIRITTTRGESMGAFTNIQGNEYSFTIPSEGFEGDPFGIWTAVGPAVIGYTTIREQIILFVADSSDAQGWIYKVEYNPYDRTVSPTSPELVYYNSLLNFKKEWPIEALGRYESDCIQRVYWTDYNNFFRSLNIVDPNLPTFLVGDVDIFPNITYTQTLLNNIGGGGNVLGGLYQASYRLITSDGKETLIAPPGNLFHMVANSESTPSGEYNGDLVPATTNTGKTFTVEVDTSGYSNFDKIEFVILHYPSTTTTPIAYSIGQVSIANQSLIQFTYTGINNSVIPLELLTFTTKNFAFKTPKTIAQKDNSLLVANIKGSTVNLADLLEPGESFDAKTRRYRKIGAVISTPFPIDPDPLDPTGTNLQNAFNSDYNSDAHWNQTWQTNSQYRYQSNGLTLGGEGFNISYNFHLEPFTIDGDAQPGYANLAPVPYGYPYDSHDFNDGYGVYTNTTYANHASPFISGLLKGYKRGETYRFGIVFYTLKGEATFIEYIGDIKFPDISEKDNSNNSSGTEYWPLSQQSTFDANKTIGYSLGIQFTLDFSTCPNLLNKITGYQIVRVERTATDKRRLAQGIIRTFWNNKVGPAASGSGFDLTINGEEDTVLHLMPSYQNSLLLPQTLETIADQDFQNTIGLDVYSNDIPVISLGTGNYRIKSQFLGFYSPDISFDTNNVRAIGTSVSNNPCFLMTGGYTYSADPVTNHNYISVGLPRLTEDRRRKSRTVVPITYNSIENIKKLKNSVFFDMVDTIDYNTPIVSDGWTAPDQFLPINITFYLRNYWAIDAYQGGVSGTNLNDPQGGAGGASSFPEFSKSGSNIVAQLSKISNDIFTGASITGSVADFYITSNNVTKNGLPYPKISAIGGGLDIFPIIDLVIPKRETYGGNNVNAIQNNIFIPASPFINVNNVVANTHTFRMFGGDIFLNMFTLDTSHVEFKSEFFPENASNNPKYYGHTGARTELFVVESSLNVDLANGATLRTLVQYSYTFGGNTEENEVLRQETNNSLAPRGKSLKMYNYNLTYSLENNAVTFFANPNGDSDTDCTVNDIRAYLSNVKINDEKIDSWTKYGINNFYDVDDYGPINKVINYKDIVHFIQDKAVGVYAVNRAAITTTSDGTPTGLGTGQGFGKHQYFTKVHGSIHQWAVKTTENGIYFFDALARKIFLLKTTGQEAGVNPLSEINGLHSWLQALPENIFLPKHQGGDNPILFKGVHIGKDLINDELIFTFLSSFGRQKLGNNTTYYPGDLILVVGIYYLVETEFETGRDPIQNFQLLQENSKIIIPDISLVYDELMQKFSSFYSAAPTIWIENSDTLISPDPSNVDDLYVHNIGNWGVFYNNIIECSLTLVINPQADINKILRTIEFNSIVRDNNKVIDRTRTITAFKITTEYQDTGKVPYSSGRIKRKFDKWRVKIPRDSLSNNQQARLRSTHFVLTLYFDNQNNQEIIVNRLMSYFDYQVF
jgi:hypothetical protein